MSRDGPTRSAVEHREAFDASFAQPTALKTEATLGLLAVRTGAHALALPAGEVAAISRCPPLVALPSRHPALCGLASVRSELTAIFDLAALIGAEPGTKPGGWIALCAKAPTVALRFEELIGYHSVEAGSVLGSSATGASLEVVEVQGIRCALVRISDLLGRLEQGAVSDPREE